MIYFRIHIQLNTVDYCIDTMDYLEIFASIFLHLKWLYWCEYKLSPYFPNFFRAQERCTVFQNFATSAGDKNTTEKLEFRIYKNENTTGSKILLEQEKDGFVDP